MREWFEGLVGPDYAVPAMAGSAALAALILLFILFRIFRYFTAGTYVAGGRNRKTRLAVMDATAIDNHRRLVLVRRDDVEHLILIGGAADVVVERDIRLAGQMRRPAPVEVNIEPPAPVAEPVVRQPVQRPPAQPAPPPRQPAPPVSTMPRPVTPPPPAPVMRPAPQRVAPTPVPAGRAPMPAAKSLDEDFDDDLLRELEVELDTDKPAPAKAPAISLDDEMTRLLGELSSHKR